MPTGYGKSLVYQSWPVVADRLARDGFQSNLDSIVLVVCPLLSVMAEQMGHLMLIGLKAAYIGKDRTTNEGIKNGHYNMVYGSPELTPT